MGFIRIFGILALFGFLQGCASTLEMEARQLAWDGSGKNPCLLGGVTEVAQQHCMSVRWQDNGMLMAMNRTAMENLPKLHPCQAHVARLEKALESHPEYTHERLYSCPTKNNPNGDCHVSLLVHDQEGRSMVLDNGAVLNQQTYTASIASLNAYADELGTVYWIGYMPEDARDVAMSNFGKFN